MSEPLGPLPREVRPPDSLESRVVGVLRDAGLIRSSRLRWILAAAAMIVVGFLGGALWSRPQPVQGPEFILLLHGAASAAPVSPEVIQGRVNEYRQWAQGVRASGHVISGEKLRDSRIVVGSSSAASGSVQGFFRVAPSSAEEAERIVRSCPHLKYGGWIELREIQK